MPNVAGFTLAAPEAYVADPIHRRYQATRMRSVAYALAAEPGITCGFSQPPGANSSGREQMSRMATEDER